MAIKMIHVATYTLDNANYFQMLPIFASNLAYHFYYFKGVVVIQL